MKDKVLNSRINCFGLWHVKSDELFRAAKILWHCDTIDTPIKKYQGKGDASKLHIHYGAASLLMGLSLETLAKAIIIKRTPLLLTEAKFPGNLDTHTLTGLFKKVKIDFSEEEEQLLNCLTAAVRWTSKYPAPKYSSEWESKNMFRNENNFILFEKLRKRLLEIEASIPYRVRETSK